MRFVEGIDEISSQVLIGNISAKEGYIEVLKLIKISEDGGLNKTSHDLIHKLELEITQ